MKFVLRIFDNEKNHYLKEMTIEASTYKEARQIADLYWNNDSVKDFTITLDEVTNDSKDCS